MSDRRGKIVLSVALLGGLAVALAGCASSSMPPASPQAMASQCGPDGGRPDQAIINGFARLRQLAGESPDSSYQCPPGFVQLGTPPGQALAAAQDTLNQIAAQGAQQATDECVSLGGDPVTGTDRIGQTVVRCFPTYGSVDGLQTCQYSGGVWQSANGAAFACVDDNRGNPISGVRFPRP